MLIAMFNNAVNLVNSIHWCPLGSGAIAGNALGIDRQFLADTLNFKNGPTLSSSQCTGNRDGVVDFLYVCSITFVGQFDIR